MNRVMKISALSLLIATAIGISAARGVDAAKPAGSDPVTGSQLIYSYDEMFNFDIKRYLAKKSPHLVKYSEVISHWAGYSSISQKVLIALMEQQSGVVTGMRAQADSLRRPFGNLSKKSGFNEQVKDVSDQLRTIVYSQRDAEIKAIADGVAKPISPNPLQTLYLQNGETSADAATLGSSEFLNTYGLLFNETLGVQPKADMVKDALNTKAGPAAGVLQLPFPRGESWYVGGAHTNTGQGNYPMSSLDMSLGGGWGSNQSNVRVSTSAAGVVKVHSSCFIEIVHNEGWSTTHYHMDNLRNSTGDNVPQGAYIGNPANNQGQALCDGGFSTGPHQHWSLKYNGSQYHLNQVTLSNYLITATGTSYDTNCDLFYLTKDGNKYCSGRIDNP